jgi:hypothetical protein
MWEVSAETVTGADPGAIWALWEDPARWKDWNEQIASATLDGPFAEGSTARIRFKRSPVAFRFAITGLEDGRTFVDETRFPGARLGHEHAIQTDAERTTISHRLFIDGPLERVYVLLMGRQMRASVKAFGEREAALAQEFTEGRSS